MLQLSAAVRVSYSDTNVPNFLQTVPLRGIEVLDDGLLGELGRVLLSGVEPKSRVSLWRTRHCPMLDWMVLTLQRRYRTAIFSQTRASRRESEQCLLKPGAAWRWTRI